MLRGDPASSDEEHMRIMLAQTEVERVKFVVRSYIRTRLYKVTFSPSTSILLSDYQRRCVSWLQIEEYARYITTNADVQSRISVAEREHASR
jgi:GINS complex subunit 4